MLITGESWKPLYRRKIMGVTSEDLRRNDEYILKRSGGLIGKDPNGQPVSLANLETLIYRKPGDDGLSMFERSDGSFVGLTNHSLGYLRLVKAGRG